MTLNSTHKTRFITGSILFFIGITLVAIYANSLQGAFVLDDGQNIVTNPFIRISSLSLRELRQVLSAKQPCSHRILPNITFALNYYFGALNPAGYHAVNIIIHIVNSWLLFFLFRWYWQRVPPTRQWNVPLLCGLAVLLWSTNPLQTNAVTYIVQRMTSMSAMFCLMTLIFYLKARTLTTEGKARYYSLFLLYFLSIMSWFAAMISKENAAILPLIILIHEIYFFDVLVRIRTNKKTAVIFLLLITLPLLAALLYMGPDFIQTILNGYRNRSFTLSERLLTEPRVVFHYISLFLYPHPDRFSLYHDNYPISHGLFSPLTTLPALISTCLWLLAIVFFYNKNRLISFGLLWVFAWLLIESTIIPLEILFEHRFYMPSIGFVLLLITGLVLIWNKIRIAPSILYIALAGVILLQSLGTITRNEDWKSNLLFDLNAVGKAPHSPRALTNLGCALAAHDQPELAITTWKKTLKSNPDDLNALGNIFIVIRQHPEWNQDNEAIAYQQKIVSLVTSGKTTANHNEILYKLATQFFQDKQYRISLLLLTRISTFLHEPDVLFNIAQCYLESGQLQKALPYLEQVHDIDADNHKNTFYLALCYHDLGDEKQAIRLLKNLDTKEINDKKQQQRIHSRLGQFLQQQNTPQKRAATRKNIMPQ